MITERINNNLSALFEIDKDPIYRALISDKDGTIPVIINIPTDIDIGVIASQLEYLRELAINMAKQLFIDEAESTFLTYILNNFFNSLQLQDESDAQWVQRVTAIVFAQKVSRASIILALRPFSSLEPEIINISSESAFADFSFCDIFESGKYLLDGTYIFYMAANAENYESSLFSIKITLQDTLSTDIYTIQDIIDKIIAAGISVKLQINYTV
jgi:hypothetical protein